MNLVRGKIEMHVKAFAFLIPDDKDQSDVYIHHSDLASAMNNDKVLVRLEQTSTEEGHRPEGRVIRVLERAIHQVVGTFEDSKSFGFVIADDKRIPNDIFIPKNKTHGAISGHKVIAQITKYPEKRMSAEGEIIKILRLNDGPGIDIIHIVYVHGIPMEFLGVVLQQAAEPTERVSDEEIAERRDVRDDRIVTLDGA